MNRKPTAKEALETLERQAYANKVLRDVLAMSDEDIDRELVRAGYGLDERRGRAPPVATGAKGAAPPRPWSSPWMVLAAFVCVLLLLGVLRTCADENPARTSPPTPSAAGPP
jgi:hypothetical protein